MKSIFLCENFDCPEKVYSKETVSALGKKAGLDPTFYNKADIIYQSEKFKDVEYIFSTWSMPELTQDEIKKYLPSLKAVFYAAGSVQSFARPFLNCGIKVFSAWAANAVPVAEYTVAQIILANKGYFQTSIIGSKEQREHAHSIAQRYPGNFNVKIGIIGAGMIGRLVINMLKAYNMQVLVFDPFLSDEAAKELGVTKCSLETLFAECHVVSNHLANNEQTKGILNGNHFNKMLPFATFINTGRGAQVVEADLIEFLKIRKDVFAILDVTDPEPPEQGSQLYTLENCILTPHIAGSMGNEVCRMSEYMLMEYENLVNNAPCKYEVTLEMLKTMA